MVRPKFPMRKSIFLCACPHLDCKIPIFIINSPIFIYFHDQNPNFNNLHSSWCLILRFPNSNDVCTKIQIFGYKLNPVVSGEFSSTPKGHIPWGFSQLQEVLGLEGASAGRRPRLFHPAAPDHAAALQLAGVHGLQGGAAGGGAAGSTKKGVDTMGKPRKNHGKTMGKMKIW